MSFKPPGWQDSQFMYWHTPPPHWLAHRIAAPLVGVLGGTKGRITNPNAQVTSIEYGGFADGGTKVWFWFLLYFDHSFTTTGMMFASPGLLPAVMRPTATRTITAVAFNPYASGGVWGNATMRVDVVTNGNVNWYWPSGIFENPVQVRYTGSFLK